MLLSLSLGVVGTASHLIALDPGVLAAPQMMTPASHHPGLPKVYTIKILNIEIDSNRPRESRSCRYLTWCKPPSVKNLRGQTGTSVSGQTL